MSIKNTPSVPQFLSISHPIFPCNNSPRKGTVRVLFFLQTIAIINAKRYSRKGTNNRFDNDSLQLHYDSHSIGILLINSFLQLSYNFSFGAVSKQRLIAKILVFSRAISRLFFIMRCNYNDRLKQIPWYNKITKEIRKQI